MAHISIKMTHKKQAFQLLEQVIHHNKTPALSVTGSVSNLGPYTILLDKDNVVTSTPIEEHTRNMLDSIAHLGNLGLTAEDIVVAMAIQLNYQKELVGDKTSFEQAAINKNEYYAQMLKMMPVKLLKFFKSVYDLIILKGVK